jgi:hypothetical protein
MPIGQASFESIGLFCEPLQHAELSFCNGMCSGRCVVMNSFTEEMLHFVSDSPVESECEAQHGKPQEEQEPLHVKHDNADGVH